MLGLLPLFFEIGLKGIDIFMINSAFKNKLMARGRQMQENHHRAVKRNSAIKRRYDEAIYKRRKAREKK